MPKCFSTASAKGQIVAIDVEIFNYVRSTGNVFPLNESNFPHKNINDRFDHLFLLWNTQAAIFCFILHTHTSRC